MISLSVKVWYRTEATALVILRARLKVGMITLMAAIATGRPRNRPGGDWPPRRLQIGFPERGPVFRTQGCRGSSSDNTEGEGKRKGRPTREEERQQAPSNPRRLPI